MPRTARASVGGVCYHVLNRGNGQTQVYHTDADYQGFVNLIAAGSERLPMRVVAACLMPNHFHLVLWPFCDGDLSRWMQWLMTSHVRRYHRRYGGSGHVWQGRFKAFPIQQDRHLLTVIRYVERNPVRARLVERAEDWPWSSLQWGASPARPPFLTTWPIERPRNWQWRVNQPETEMELAAMRHSVDRGAPFGSQLWTRRTAIQLGLESTIRSRGRPRKDRKK